MNKKFIYHFMLMMALLISSITQVVSAQSTVSVDSPQVPDGFVVSVYAREPLVRNPCAMAFDTRGRLFIGQGPQYRSPKPDSPTDRVTLLIDTDKDGVADSEKTFAEGFNSIQGMAWHGDQLWIANSPDLTVIRDTDGDDEADEYRRIYGGLGNLEHGLHGLVFAPDGRLYMSKGNSKGYLNINSPERFIAPAAFSDLWGVEPPEGTPTAAETEVFTRESYQHGYHTPSDDWGTEGGILRCRPDGTQLEVFARGMRNMWDMNFDADFNWIGTDQDQDGGDRLLNPIHGAHFGWGHPWSSDWTGENHLPSMPISGPLFHGSGTGVVSCASDQFSDKYRDAFFCADWLNRSIFVYRSKWDGALMRNMSKPEIFAKAPHGRSMGSSKGMLFDPTDIEFGPDGALWVLSWGHGYGSEMENGQQHDEGRIYRISFGKSINAKLEEKYSKAYTNWTREELIEDLRHNTLPVCRTNAQTELIRRGDSVIDDLITQLQKPELPRGATTWLIWTLAQIPEQDSSIDDLLNDIARLTGNNQSRRIQALNALGHRARQMSIPLSTMVKESLKDKKPRIRLAAVQAIQESRATEFVSDLWELISKETDRSTFYSARIAIGLLEDPQQLREKMANGTVGQRKAALLTLLEHAALTGDDVLPLRLDNDPIIAEIASSFVSIVGTSQSPVLSIEPKDEVITSSTSIQIVTGKIPEGLHVRYSTDGAEPTDTTGTKYSGPIQLKNDSVVSASLFKGRERMGPVVRRKYTITSSDQAGGRIMDSSVVYPVKVSKVILRTGQPYEKSIFQRGERAYVNRKYVWTDIPDGFAGHTFIQPRNGDEDVGSTGEKFLSFSITEPAEIYVAHDKRITEKPGWLNQFTPTEFNTVTRDATYRLFVKSFPAGTITLGGNTRDGQASARSQYVCIVKPAPLLNREVATTIEQSLKKLPSADFHRGARLFFQQAECAKCHRMGERGNAFAPNLTNMGTRATPETIAQSILKPSAVIMEGFHSLAVLTDSGQIYSGFIKQESGLSVELVQADGKLITIPKAEIEERKRQQISVMPEGLAKQLNPQQVADLIRFIKEAGENPSLLTSAAMVPNQDKEQSKENDRSKSKIVMKTEPLDTTLPVTFEDNGKALLIRCGNKKLATYFYQHDQILRPFFAHVKAPSGTQVTRNFPPGKGDSKDHADMHPGLWMAFGDISGSDFWRNKGRVIHDHFNGKPQGGAGRGSFSERKSYLLADGSVGCVEDFLCTIHVLSEGYLLEWDSTFSAPPGKEFSFSDQEEMGLGIRVATAITEKKQGQISDSEGRASAKEIWSQSSKWCDYSGIIGNEELGITILCHPENFRESWMHARDYGLLVANPFGRKAMNKGSVSRINVKPGEPLRLRYGIFIHGSTPDLNQIHQQYIMGLGTHKAE